MMANVSIPALAAVAWTPAAAGAHGGALAARASGRGPWDVHLPGRLKWKEK